MFNCKKGFFVPAVCERRTSRGLVSFTLIGIFVLPIILAFVVKVTGKVFSMKDCSVLELILVSTVPEKEGTGKINQINTIKKTGRIR